MNISAIWDYNTLMEENFSRGILQGRAEGRAEGVAEGMEKGIANERAAMLAKMKAFGMSDSDINKILNINP